MNEKGLSLGIIWNLRREIRGKGGKLQAEGRKLWAKGDKLWAKGDKQQGRKLWAEGDKLWGEGSRLQAEWDKLWGETILEFHRNLEVFTEVSMLERENSAYELETREIFEPY